MGSVKDLMLKGPIGEKFYRAPTATEFGQGAWRVSGRYSVADLKDMIPDSNIPDKAEALAMMTGRFYEWLRDTHPDIKTCYKGVVGPSGELTDTGTLLTGGDRTNMVVMKLAHVPESFSGGNLAEYRAALSSGELLCGVADVESIFRHGFPLGSSFFKKVFEAAGRGREYETLATYNDTALALAQFGAEYIKAKKGKAAVNTPLETLLNEYGLERVPYPGFVLRDIVYDTTTKFEEAGDRKISREEAAGLSGLDAEGYTQWATAMFPALARAEIEFCDDRNMLNIDGKAECVAYHRKPVVTDFACTIDENRLMILYTAPNGVVWEIPSNKEIQRAVFRQEGVYAAIDDAKAQAKNQGNVDDWKKYLPGILHGRGIDLQEVSDHSCKLMGFAVGEVANRLLGVKAFDAEPLDAWVKDYLPYASRYSAQKG